MGVSARLNENAIKGNIMNKKQVITQKKNITAVKSIITKHHSKNSKKIKESLAVEHKIKVSLRTVKRYLAIIENQNKKQIAKKVKIAQVKQEQIEEEKITYPYFIKDPSGKEHKIMGDNHTIEISWGIQGMIYWDVKDELWRYRYDNTPFDKNKKITPWYKSRRLSFEFNDLND